MCLKRHTKQAAIRCVPHSVTVDSLPDGAEVSRAWLYGKAVEQGNEQSVFSGAELVEA